MVSECERTAGQDALSRGGRQIDLPVLHISVLPMVGAGVQAFSSYVLILAAALLMFTKAF